MILFHLQCIGSERQIPVLRISEKKKIEKQINFFSEKSHFLHIFCLSRVFTGKRSNIQKVVCDGLGNSISYKMMFGSAS